MVILHPFFVQCVMWCLSSVETHQNSHMHRAHLDVHIFGTSLIFNSVWPLPLLYSNSYFKIFLPIFYVMYICEARILKKSEPISYMCLCSSEYMCVEDAHFGGREL